MAGNILPVGTITSVETEKFKFPDADGVERDYIMITSIHRAGEMLKVFRQNGLMPAILSQIEGEQ